MQRLLCHRSCWSISPSSVCDQQQGREEVNAEGSCREFGKALGKPLVRALKKLSLIGATLVAVGDVVQLALKLICCGALSSAAVARLVLVHPTLPAECVNNLLCSADPSTTPVDLAFDSAAAMNKRLAMIKCTFPCGSTRIASPQQRLECLASMLRHSDIGGLAQQAFASICSKSKVVCHYYAYVGGCKSISFPDMPEKLQY